MGSKRHLENEEAQTEQSIIISEGLYIFHDDEAHEACISTPQDVKYFGDPSSHPSRRLLPDTWGLYGANPSI